LTLPWILPTSVMLIFISFKSMEIKLGHRQFGSMMLELSQIKRKFCQQSWFLVWDCRLSALILIE